MDGGAYFSADYLTARQRFRTAATAFGWPLDERELPAAGPAGERLWIDAATSPLADADRTLVVSSGLHGVEGFFGSAVQLALLDRWRSRPPVHCVLVHALNPFGFAALRRTDDRNVDLNRNFLLEGEEYAGAPPGYAALDAVLNPTTPPRRSDPFVLKLAPVIARRGTAAIRRSVAVGQYDFPRGLFYGGAGLTAAARTIADALRSWLASARSVVHLDLHTGLGRWAEGQVLLDYFPDPRQLDHLTRWFGPRAFSTPASADYTARGGLGRWCVSHGLAESYLFGYAEFGTFSGLRVLAGLRAENQAHHWGRPGDPATARAKLRLMDLFCPPSLAWRHQAVTRGLTLISKAAEGVDRMTEPVAWLPPR